MALTAWTLALDTAGADTVVAVRAGDGPIAARREGVGEDGRPRHTRAVLGLADAARTDAGLAWDGLARIVVGLGPGSFVGVRVGVATARALALPTPGRGAVELVGLPGPWALAAAARAPGEPGEGRAVLVLQDARRREVYATLVPADAEFDAATAGAPWAAPRAVPVADLGPVLAAMEAAGAVVVGDAARVHADLLRGVGAVVPDDPEAHRLDGSALLRAATRLPVRSAPELRPVYVRDADALPTSRRP